MHKVFTRSYIGVENITDTDGVTYATRKVHELAMQVDSIMSFHNPSLPETTTYTTDYWNAPTIGWIVKDSTCDGVSGTRSVLDGCTVH